jgi:Flp pilus assembly protein TadG
MIIMLNLYKRFGDDQKGSTVVEFALVGTFVAVCLVSLIDLATAINSFTKLSSGMRAGSQYALSYPSDDTGIRQAIASASSLPASDMTVTTSQFCEVNNVGSSCTPGGGSGFAKYISITATYSMDGRYIYNLAGYPQSLSKNIAVRIQ